MIADTKPSIPGWSGKYTRWKPCFSAAMAVVLPMHATAMSATSLPAVIWRHALPQTHAQSEHTQSQEERPHREATKTHRNSEDLHVTNPYSPYLHWATETGLSYFTCWLFSSLL